MSQIDQSCLARGRESVLCCVQRFMLLPSETALRRGPELIWISQGPTAFLANCRRFWNSTFFFWGAAAAEVPVQNHNGVYFSPTKFSGIRADNVRMSSRCGMTRSAALRRRRAWCAMWGLCLCIFFRRAASKPAADFCWSAGASRADARWFLICAFFISSIVLSSLGWTSSYFLA